MKSVLISIQPKWCELIASGKKTVEIRKTKPNLAIPFKCYIYQTRKTWVYNIYSRIADWQGKVIGEFVCDSITEWRADPQSKGYFITMDELALTLLTYGQLHEYGKGQTLFGWHISNLVIYDKPKELRAFRVVDNEAVKECQYRERIYNNPDLTNGALLLGTYLCRDKTNWCTKCKTKPLTRPPQSWCYVEVLR